ncbi:hypothetical protein RISK_003332 [Rhodopirellula islandica]|uniref:Uncharacterized protein n=1 Tax=Rhodopirellula islandica TaxID=595434 RepID=A0A0J1BDU5_RHOIS|nr:hypothetical protein RISK_003332 [Rhodopirellula islandica]
MQRLQNPARETGGVGKRAFSEISGGGQFELPSPRTSPRSAYPCLSVRSTNAKHNQHQHHSGFHSAWQARHSSP